MTSWWNGRHAGLKNRSPKRGVKVRILLGLPFLLSCSILRHETVGVTETHFDGCESIDLTPDNNEEWASLCYCAETDKGFSDCIDAWHQWNRDKHL